MTEHPEPESDSHQGHYARESREISIQPEDIDLPIDRLKEALATWSTSPEMLAAIERWHMTEVDCFDVKAWAARLSLILGTIIGSVNPRTTTLALAYAIASPIIQGKSMRQTAREIGVSPNTIPKAVSDWQARLQLRRSSYQWSDASRASYKAKRSAKT